MMIDNDKSLPTSLNDKPLLITDEQKCLLQHMLGADSRYKKKQWGFRNLFVTSPGCNNFQTLKLIECLGLVVSHIRFDKPVFLATKKGAIAIGFKPYQLKNAGLN